MTEEARPEDPRLQRSREAEKARRQSLKKRVTRLKENVKEINLQAEQHRLTGASISSALQQLRTTTSESCAGASLATALQTLGKLRSTTVEHLSQQDLESHPGSALSFLQAQVHGMQPPQRASSSSTGASETRQSQSSSGQDAGDLGEDEHAQVTRHSDEDGRVADDVEEEDEEDGQDMLHGQSSRSASSADGQEGLDERSSCSASSEASPRAVVRKEQAHQKAGALKEEEIADSQQQEEDEEYAYAEVQEEEEEEEELAEHEEQEEEPGDQMGYEEEDEGGQEMEKHDQNLNEDPVDEQMSQQAPDQDHKLREASMAEQDDRHARAVDKEEEKQDEQEKREEQVNSEDEDKEQQAMETHYKESAENTMNGKASTLFSQQDPHTWEEKSRNKKLESAQPQLEEAHDKANTRREQDGDGLNKDLGANEGALHEARRSTQLESDRDGVRAYAQNVCLRLAKDEEEQESHRDGVHAYAQNVCLRWAKDEEEQESHRDGVHAYAQNVCLRWANDEEQQNFNQKLKDYQARKELEALHVEQPPLRLLHIFSKTAQPVRISRRLAQLHRQEGLVHEEERLVGEPEPHRKGLEERAAAWAAANPAQRRTLDKHLQDIEDRHQARAGKLQREPIREVMSTRKGKTANTGFDHLATSSPDIEDVFGSDLRVLLRQYGASSGSGGIWGNRADVRDEVLADIAQELQIHAGSDPNPGMTEFAEYLPDTIREATVGRRPVAKKRREVGVLESLPLYCQYAMHGP